ncbi:hypothetical protein Bca4012_043640 [Brassica carinata]|uniref:Uncharacterized protein n=2 Tax=Brassica TaxID=3705 RepID=A0A8X7UHI5_BRACI|nr:hypothetical protein Bca52824_058711 [Brassica carinata]
MASSCYSGHCRASSNISPWEELQTASVFVGYLGCSLPHFPFFVHRRLRISDGKKLRSWWVVGRWCRALLEDNGDTLDFRKLSIGAKASFGAVAVGSSGDEAKAKIQSAAVSRTSAPPELKMHIRGEGPHTFENIEYHMVIDEGLEEPPSYPDLMRKTHTRKNGTFIDERAEALVLETDTQGHHLWTWQCATVKRSLDMEMQTYFKEEMTKTQSTLNMILQLLQPQASNSSAFTAQPTQAQRQSQSYSQAQPQGQGQAPFSGSVSSSR